MDDWYLETFGLEGEPCMEPTDYTCYVCYFNTLSIKGSWPGCEWMFDEYNTLGDCLDEK